MSALWSWTRGWLATAVLLAVWGVAGGAWAGHCSISLTVESVTIPYSDTAATKTVNVSVHNYGDAVCKGVHFGIANTSISPDGTAGALTAGLPLAYAAQFDLAGANSLFLNSTAKQKIDISISNLAKNATSVTQVTLRIPPNAGLPLGANDINFVGYAYWEGLKNGDPNEGFSNLQKATINVQSSFFMSLAGGGTATTLDFMNLTMNATRSVMLNVRASAAYRITMASTLPNPVPGRLQLVGNSNPAWSIPYTATLGGQTISTSVPLLFATGTTGGNIVQSLFEVRIGAVGNVRAGVYREVVTLTIAANP